MYYVMQDTKYCLYVCITKINVLEDILSCIYETRCNFYSNTNKRSKNHASSILTNSKNLTL